MTVVLISNRPIEKVAYPDIDRFIDSLTEQEKEPLDKGEDSEWYFKLGMLYERKCNEMDKLWRMYHKTKSEKEKKRILQMINEV